MKTDVRDLTDEELEMLRVGGVGAWWVFVVLWLVSLALSIIFTPWFLISVVIMSLAIAGTGNGNDDLVAEISRRRFNEEEAEEL